MSANITQVREAAGSAGAAATQVLSSARELANSAQSLDHALAEFLNGLPAA